MPTAAPRRRLINDPGFVRLWAAETISHLAGRKWRIRWVFRCAARHIGHQFKQRKVERQ